MPWITPPIAFMLAVIASVLLGFIIGFRAGSERQQKQGVIDGR